MALPWMLRAASHRHVSSCRPLSWRLLKPLDADSSLQFQLVPLVPPQPRGALPLLNNGKSCAKSKWPAELLRCAYKEVTMEDGKVSKLYVLAPILAALLNNAFQSGTLPAAVMSSLITPVFKKGDESDTSNYCPIAVGEPLCRLYAAILNSRIVNWAESNGLRAPCQAVLRPRLSTEHQLFALRHFIDRSDLRTNPYLQLL